MDGGWQGRDRWQCVSFGVGCSCYTCGVSSFLSGYKGQDEVWCSGYIEGLPGEARSAGVIVGRILPRELGLLCAVKTWFQSRQGIVRHSTHALHTFCTPVLGHCLL